ncbi:MAG: Ig-like domain repeat protein [Devosia sp.]
MNANAFALIATTTTLSSSANPSVLGASVTFTATVTDAMWMMSATGTVTFKDGATTLGTGTLNGASQASFSTSALTIGSHAITATYGGDFVFNPSTSSILTQDVTTKPTTTSLVSSINPSLVGAAITFTATVTGATTPTGMVTFKDGATTLGTDTLDGAGQASFSTSALTIGSHDITAVYGGDAVFSTSTSSILTQVVTAKPTSTSLASSANPSVVGGAITFTAAVTGTTMPTGMVTFKDGATTLGTDTLDGAGEARFSTSALAVGSHDITVVYGGDPSFSASTSSILTQVITANPSATSLASSTNPSGVGDAVTFTATVTGATTPTGMVTFKDGATTLGSDTLDGAGQASFSTSALTIGSHDITAIYGGDASFSASTSPILTQFINSFAGATSVSATSLVSSANPSVLGAAVTFTATVTGATTPTGMVTFKDGAATLGTGTLDGTGKASFVASTLTAGSHAISAVYGGDMTYYASTSAILSQTVDVLGDSAHLRSWQLAASKIVAQQSGTAISAALNAAIADGFADCGAVIAASQNGMRLSMGAKSQAPSTVDGDQPLNPWCLWVHVRGFRLGTNAATADQSGGQINALAGMTRRISPDFLVGAFGGYERFDYSSRVLNSQLDGEGLTVGTYMGWRLRPGLQLDGGIAHSELLYRGAAGTAAGSFSASRTLITLGLRGSYAISEGLEIEPSARALALWESQASYNDTLGTEHAQRNFMTLHASLGARVIYRLPLSQAITIAPYLGVYMDYSWSYDDASVPSAPSDSTGATSARLTTGITVTASNGASVSLGGELGELGSANSLSAGAHVAIPF